MPDKVFEEKMKIYYERHEENFHLGTVTAKTAVRREKLSWAKTEKGIDTRTNRRPSL